MILRWPTVGAAVVFGAAAAPLVAQEASFSLGGIHTTYADTLSGTAVTGGARVRYQSSRFWTQVDGYVSRFTSGGWTSQGNVSLLTMFPVNRHLAAGIRADGNLAAFEGGTWSGIGGLGPYAALSSGSWIGAVAATFGGVRDIYGTSDPLVTSSLRASRPAGPFTFDARLSVSWSDTVRFGDAMLGAVFTTSDLTLSALGGTRVGDLGNEPWLQGMLEWRLTPHLQFESAVGTYPADLTGFSNGFFVTAGIRVGTRRRAVPAEPAVDVRRVDEATVQVTFRIRGASAVAIAGEWNAWTPTPLSQIDSRHWRAVLSLGPGAYRFSLILDGEEWIVPDGVPTLPDDFGGRVGLLLVGGQDD